MHVCRQQTAASTHKNETRVKTREARGPEREHTTTTPHYTTPYTQHCGESMRRPLLGQQTGRAPGASRASRPAKSELCVLGLCRNASLSPSIRCVNLSAHTFPLLRGLSDARSREPEVRTDSRPTDYIAGYFNNQQIH